MKNKVVNYITFGAALASGVIHLYVGITDNDLLLVANGVVFAALSFGVFLHKVLVKKIILFLLWLLALITFVLYFLMHAEPFRVHAHGGNKNEEKVVEQVVTPEIINEGLVDDDSLETTPSDDIEQVTSNESTENYSSSQDEGLNLDYLAILAKASELVILLTLPEIILRKRS